MKYIVHILIAALLIISCSTAKVAHVEEPKNDSVYGRRFKLTSKYPDMGITIVFEPNKIYGFSAVNDYSSLYTIDGDIFNILSISITKKSGPREKIAAELEYLNMLKNATSYKIEGHKLTIYTLLSSENLVFEEF